MPITSSFIVARLGTTGSGDMSGAAGPGASQEYAAAMVENGVGNNRAEAASARNQVPCAGHESQVVIGGPRLSNCHWQAMAIGKGL